MPSKKKVLENSFLYIFSSLLVKAMGFILLPIYTYFLSPNDFGVINLITGFINVATFVISFSLYSAAIRFYIDYKEDKYKLKKIYSTLINFLILSSLISLGLAILFKNLIAKVFFEGIEFYPIILIAFLNLIFMSLFTMHQSILQGMQQGRKLTIINLSVLIITALIKVVFIGVYEFGVIGFLMAQLIVYIFYSFFIFYDLIKNHLFEWTIDVSLLKETLKYSIPLMPHNLSTNISSLASRIFINASRTLASVGIYSIAMQFGNLIDLIQIAVNRAFQPWFYTMMKKHDVKSIKEAVDLSYVLLVFYSIIYMVVGLFSQEAVLLMTNDNYVLSWTLIPIIVVSFSIKSIYYFYVNIIMYYKKATRKLFVTTTIGSFSDIILAYLLVPVFGMYGSAISFLVAKLIIVFLVINLSKRYDDIGYSGVKMLSIIIPSLLFMAVGVYFSYTRYMTMFSITNFIYKLIILFIYMGFVFYTNRKIINKAIKSGHLLKVLIKKKRKKDDI